MINLLLNKILLAYIFLSSLHFILFTQKQSSWFVCVSQKQTSLLIAVDAPQSSLSYVAFRVKFTPATSSASALQRASIASNGVGATFCRARA